MLRSPFDREIARLAIPALGTLVAEPLYVLADTAFVGHLGTNELAGLALATTILLTIHAVLIFLAYGTTGPVARLIASGNTTEAAHRSWQAIWLAGLLGVGSVAVVAVLGGPLLSQLSSEPAVLAAAERYLFISLIGFPFLIITMAASGALHGRQNAKTPLVLAVAGALGNLVIEFVLIRVLGYGIGASALSTVVVQVAIGLIAIYLLGRWANENGVRRGPDTHALVALLRSGKALLVRGIFLRGSFTLATMVALSIGVTELAAHQIVFGIWATLTLALDAVAIAGQALTGKWLGQGDLTQAKAATRRMIEVDVGVGALMGLVVFVFRSPLAGLFTEDLAVSSIVAFLLIHLAVQQPLNGAVFALDGILIGAGDFNYLAKSIVMAAIVFGACTGLVLVTGAGIGWLWVCVAVLMASRLVGLFTRWRTDQWLQMPAAGQ